MIKWEEIWKIHSPGFKDGFAVIPIGGGFRLHPGPGFGDLSHPTTKLILELMKPLVQGKVVCDVGCGSGILSIAAALLGARAVYSFEIDPDAITHARNNFKLNNLQIPINETPPAVDLICINMISSEQRVALAQYPFLNQGILLASGLLVEEKDSYLASMAPTWVPVKELQEAGWLALKLTSN